MDATGRHGVRARLSRTADGMHTERTVEHVHAPEFTGGRTEVGAPLTDDIDLARFERPIEREVFREPAARRSAPEAADAGLHGDAAVAPDVVEALAASDTLGERAQRLLSVLLAAAALVALAPLMLLVALAVRLSSPGPVIYVQERVGQDRRRLNASAAGPGSGATPAEGLADGQPLLWTERRRVDYAGRPYPMYKFRTMRVDAEADGRPVWATREDPRVTPVGRVLRKLRLDELPQLINVLHGDMSLVGPRPERPTIVLRLREQIDGYALRQRVPPGITGWAQINQAYDTCLDDVRAKVRYDLEYVQRRGVAEDLRILWRTIPVMLGRRGGW
jgi:lipopolysaccharide/colanic/teichoic acid biosynthesis glycosyltransferase